MLRTGLRKQPLQRFLLASWSRAEEAAPTASDVWEAAASEGLRNPNPESTRFQLLYHRLSVKVSLRVILKWFRGDRTDEGVARPAVGLALSCAQGS